MIHLSKFENFSEYNNGTTPDLDDISILMISICDLIQGDEITISSNVIGHYKEEFLDTEEDSMYNHNFDLSDLSILKKYIGWKICNIKIYGRLNVRCSMDLISPNGDIYKVSGDGERCDSTQACYDASSRFNNIKYSNISVGDDEAYITFNDIKKKI